MRVSVIVPCYNAEPYLAQAIGSALDQARPPDEVIVVDDGSTDGSVAVAESFGDRIDLITGRNGGAPQTRNRGAARATGDALMFLDADDVLGPTALDALVDTVRPGAIAVCPWYRLELVDGVWVKRPPTCRPRGNKDPLSAWLTGWYHPPCSVLWSREAYDATGGWDPTTRANNNDGDIMMRALATGTPLLLSRRGVAYYRRLPSGTASVSGNRFTPDGLKSRIYVIEKVARTLEAGGRLGDFRPAIDEALERTERDIPAGSGDLRELSERVARRYAGFPQLRRRRHAQTRARRVLERTTRRVVQKMQRVMDLDTAGPVEQDASVEVRFGLEPADGMDSAGSPPLVSVVTPTYNRAHVLARAIESARAQTHDHLEILVVDDGSTDGTAELVNRYADSDPRVRYIRQPKNGGVSAARNRGLREARGEYVAFLDSDDEWYPDKVARQVERFQELSPRVGLVYCGVETVNGNSGWTFRPRHRGDVYDRLLFENVIHTGSGTMVRREAVEQVGGFDETIPAIEDYDYWLRIARHYDVDFVEEPLFRYFDEGGGVRKSLNTEENMEARAYFFAKHGGEMRRAGVAHRFLVESARRQLDRDVPDRAAAYRLVLKALRERPTDGDVLRVLVRLVVASPARRALAAFESRAKALTAR